MGSTMYLARCAMGEPEKPFGEGLKIPLNEYPLPLLAVTKEQADELERLSKKWSPQDDAVFKEGAD